MKKLFINASPRKKGNTAFLMDRIIEILGESSQSVTSLYEKKVLPCLDCKKCKEGKLECIVNDDMNELYAKMNTADLIVFGTPVYWFSITGPGKIFIDRLRPYFKNGKLKDKTLILVLVAGSGEKDCDLVEQMFTRICDSLEINLGGVIKREAYEPDDLKNNFSEKDKEEIRQLLKKIK